MSGLVGEERVLGEDDAECAGDEQLVPGVAKKDESGDGSAKREGDDGEHHQVETGATAKQASFANGAQQGRILGRRVGARAAGLGLGEGHYR
jgi:hypothetical protein